MHLPSSGPSAALSPKDALKGPRAEEVHVLCMCAVCVCAAHSTHELCVVCVGHGVYICLWYVCVRAVCTTCVRMCVHMHGYMC
jgi:hypothetical protein